MNAREFRLTAQVNAVVVRLRSLMTGNAAAVLHVTAAAGGEGVSTVARELVHAAARMQWCKVLLLDGNPGGNDQSRALRAPLPDIVMGYAERSAIQVLAVESDGCEFHAALWPSNVSATGISCVPVLGRLLHAAYDLIVLDCPPILAHPHLPTISDRASQVLLVVRSEESSVESVQRAKQEIEVLHGSVWGAVLTGKRRIVPSMLDRRF
jgi:Mrp family chromosome partitioning ATPase